MKTPSKLMFAMGTVAAVAAVGCVTSETDELAAEDTATATAESSFCRDIKKYTYKHPDGSYYSWHVTTQLWDGKQFVDERKLGGGFYRQYRVYPVWSECWHPNESVRLTNSAAVLNGTHVCLPDGREEYHGSDFQRLLVPVDRVLDCSY